MENINKPLPQYLNDFLDYLEIEKGLSSKTQENYSRFLKKFFDWLKINQLENLTPDQLNARHIFNYRLYLSRQCFNQKGQPLKKTTQNYYLIALRSLLSFFAEKDILSLPPEKIKLSRDKGDKQVRFLTLEQLDKLLAAPDISTLQGLRDRAILETFFSTGMRISELVSLNRNQIKPNLKELELSIVGKGGRVRTVYFSNRALLWINEYLSKRTDGDPALFINHQLKKGEKEKRITPRSIEKNLKKYLIKAGLPLNITPHTLRHTFATDLLSQGVDLRVVQEFLGHKSIAATQIYTHVTNKKLYEIHKKYHSGKRLKED
ncbi:MAG TPA: tyrosine-type recombinase/integrase [Candidatus Paceibacterota bacterium]|nr:tyrosine-type recombinase/integrase [Candidatus Paceibacterota bacterium]HPQ23075.1 tyrosine-type recombinase/integrase [Candidatus Paceibacterota bacterium]